MTCGLPKELCVCETIAKETQNIIVTTELKRFKKVQAWNKRAPSTISEAALQRRKGTDPAAGKKGPAQAQDLVAAAVGIGPQPLLVPGSKPIAFDAEADVPLVAAGAQLLQDNTPIGAAVFGSVSALNQLCLLDSIHNKIGEYSAQVGRIVDRNAVQQDQVLVRIAATDHQPGAEFRCGQNPR